MTEQAKAEEIIEKHYLTAVFSSNNPKGLDRAKAKDHAILEVKGIIEEVDMYKGELNPRWSFWTSVLTEIEKTK